MVPPSPARLRAGSQRLSGVGGPFRVCMRNRFGGYGKAAVVTVFPVHKIEGKLR